MTDRDGLDLLDLRLLGYLRERAEMSAARCWWVPR